MMAEKCDCGAIHSIAVELANCGITAHAEDVRAR
jgi:hypothetical protein